MKIGIKFCGGCNPKYDRKYAESILREHISKEHTIDYVSDYQSYDYVFIINGCQAQCASSENFHVEKNIYSIYSLKSLDDLIQKLYFLY